MCLNGRTVAKLWLISAARFPWFWMLIRCYLLSRDQISSSAVCGAWSRWVIVVRRTLVMWTMNIWWGSFIAAVFYNNSNYIAYILLLFISKQDQFQKGRIFFFTETFSFKPSSRRTKYCTHTSVSNFKILLVVSSWDDAVTRTFFFFFAKRWVPGTSEARGTTFFSSMFQLCANWKIEQDACFRRRNITSQPAFGNAFQLSNEKIEKRINGKKELWYLY